jgi:hypothetical protein
MDIAVPEDLPVLTAEEQQMISSKPLYLAPEKKDFEASAKAYFEKRDVVPMLNALLTEIYLVQPEDPIDHMLKFLLRHATMRELREHQDATAQTLHHVADQAVAYSARFKLPHLFDELLNALLAETPEDVVRFSLTWIRWHKNGFIARHVPEGYRAYLAAKDRAGSS